MRIATYNINNVNNRFDVLAAWLRKARPDVVCLQELKAAQDGFRDLPDASDHAPVWIDLRL